MSCHKTIEKFCLATAVAFILSLSNDDIFAVALCQNILATCLKDRLTNFQVCPKTIVCAQMNTDMFSFYYYQCSYWPVRDPFIIYFLYMIGDEIHSPPSSQKNI